MLELKIRKNVAAFGPIVVALGLIEFLALFGRADAMEPPRLRVIHAHASPVAAVAFSPSGDLLASAAGAGNNSVKVWETSTGRRRASFRGGGGVMTSLAFRPDGKWLACGSDGFHQTRKTWDFITFVDTSNWTVVPDAPQWDGLAAKALAFTKDGAELVIHRDVRFEFWDYAHQVERFVAIYPQPVNLPDPHIAGRRRVLWEPERAELLQSIGISPTVPASAISADGRRIAFARDGGVRVVNTAGDEIASLSVAELAEGDGTQLVAAMAMELEHGPLAVALTTFTTRTWTVIKEINKYGDVPPSETVKRVEHKATVYKTDISLWEGVPTQPRSRVVWSGDGIVPVLAFSPDGERLALCRIRGNATEIDLVVLKTGEIEAVLGQGIGRAFRCLTFSPGGTFLAAGDTNGDVGIWSSRPLGR
jgi:WD40 repeat protein